MGMDGIASSDHESNREKLAQAAANEKAKPRQSALHENGRTQSPTCQRG